MRLSIHCGNQLLFLKTINCSKVTPTIKSDRKFELKFELSVTVRIFAVCKIKWSLLNLAVVNP